MPDHESFISAEQRGDALVVTIHADSLDSNSAPAVQAAIETAAEREPGTAVILDLGEVETLTSMGLGMMVFLHTTFRKANRRFAVCGVRGDAATAIRLAQLDRILDVSRSVEDFLLRLRSHRGD